jgi:hypothetical protein
MNLKQLIMELILSIIIIGLPFTVIGELLFGEIINDY